MKLLAEYVDTRSLLNAWRRKKTIEKLERNSKNRRRPIINSPLNARQDTVFQTRARRQPSHPRRCN